MHEGIHEQDISIYSLPASQRSSEDREIDIREQECDEEPVHGERRDSVRVPRSIALSVDVSSVPTRWDGPPLITELSSVPERRTLFDGDETYEIRAERSQIVDSSFREETRDILPEEPRLSATAIPVRPTLSIETSISSSGTLGVLVMGMLEYRGGPTSAHRPGTVRTSTGTASQRVASGGGGRSDDSFSDHSHQSEGRPQVEDPLEEDEEVIFPIMGMVVRMVKEMGMVMEMVMEKRVMKVVYH